MESIESKRAERYYTVSKASGDVSDLVRNLSFAGIAVVWMLRTEWDTQSYEHIMLCSIFLFALSIMCSLLHYVIEVLLTQIYSSDAKLNKDIPSWGLSVSWVLWCLKIVFVITAYILISIVLVNLW